MSYTAENDLNNYGELEKDLYGDSNAPSYFNREFTKCIPFVQLPKEINMNKTGTANFGYSWSVVIDKKFGDYLTNMWVMVELPEVKLKPTNTYLESGTLRWTENIMHNLIREVTLLFNDQCVSKLDNFTLDFLSEFQLNSEKYDAYMRNIGNIPELTQPSKHLKSKKLFLPLPMFFCKDTSNAIPLTALPHTEIRVDFNFREWENLLILDNKATVEIDPISPVVDKDIEVEPVIKTTQLFGNFVSLLQDEKFKLGVKTSKMIIEQFQTLPRQVVSVAEENKISLNLKHSIKALYFAVRNSNYKNIWSNYNYDHDTFVGDVFVKNKDKFIIETASIKYNETYRVPEVPVEYYSFINPWYHSKRIPVKGGMYTYSYALNQSTVNACGSSALSRTDNPTLSIKLTENAKKCTDKFEMIVVASSNTIAKIAEGSLKFLYL